jgi:O-antigen/teichoic acid export membrane protein
VLIRQRAFWAAIASGSARLVELALGFLLTPFILHRLGDENYGLYILVAAIFGQGALLDFGITPAVIKYVAEHRAQRDHDRMRSLIATVQVLYCLIGLLTLLLTIPLAAALPYFFNVQPFQHDTTTMVVLLMGARLAISIPCQTPWAVLWALHKYGQANAISVLRTILTAVATVAVLLLGGGIIGMVAVTIPVILLTQLVFVWYVRRVAPEISFGFQGARREFAKIVVSYGSSLSLADIAYYVQAKSDEIIIGAFLPVSAVSPYAIARRLSVVPHILAEQALGGILPLTSELNAKGDSDRLRSLYVVASRVTFAICISLAVVLIVLAGPLLTVWVGSDYASYAPILVVLTLASVAEVSHWPGQVILQGLARHHGLVVPYICGAVAKLGLAVLLVRSHGLVGIAVATMISSIALSVIYVFPYTMRIFGVSFLQLLKQVLLPVSLPALPMISLLCSIAWAVEPSRPITLGCTACGGLVTYAIVYIVFCAGNAERDLLRTFLAKIRGNAE